MPLDQGPIYLETIMGRFPVEPWNTASNLFFLAIILYWGWRLKGEIRAHRFIAGAIPVLIIGWVGGTVYHATRSHNLWLLMDFVPIALLAAAVSMYFWHRQGVNWWWALLLILGPYVFVMAGMSFLGLPDAMRPFAGYSVWAISISLPVARYLKRSDWVDWWLVAAAATSFPIALAFRTSDGRVLVETLPIGTHFLWHSFGAAAVQFLVLYVWRTDIRATAAQGAFTI